VASATVFVTLSCLLPVIIFALVASLVMISHALNSFLRPQYHFFHTRRYFNAYCAQIMSRPLLMPVPLFLLIRKGLFMNCRLLDILEP
jgi:hypothetical protein